MSNSKQILLNASVYVSAVLSILGFMALGMEFLSGNFLSSRPLFLIWLSYGLVVIGFFGYWFNARWSLVLLVSGNLFLPFVAVTCFTFGVSRVSGWPHANMALLLIHVIPGVLIYCWGARHIQYCKSRDEETSYK